MDNVVTRLAVVVRHAVISVLAHHPHHILLFSKKVE